MVEKEKKIFEDEIEGESVWCLYGLLLLRNFRTLTGRLIGEHFQPVMDGLRKESYYVVAETVLRDYIFVHLDDNYDKFNLLIFMLQKLFSRLQCQTTQTPCRIKKSYFLVT
ncbi:hypothetical protein Pint_05606 [Pistacia integerrima]|uniref:Uncharacterized protein n=1 Tax=Pistacia integerrima TaxID=434235 RepID=A0ACC0Z2J1_9ROSI|nr:hypothetical protein Pint_05606 [Pistacia integerrima]